MGFFITFLVFAALFVATELLRPKPTIENARPAALGDFKFPTVDEARVVPLLWGTARQKGPNVIWYGNVRQEAITERVRTGMFSKATVIKGYRNFMTVVFALCRGSDTAPVELRQILVKDEPVGGAGYVLAPNIFGGDEFGAGGLEGQFTFHTGTSTQAPNAYLAAQGVNAIGGVTLRYSNTAYGVFEDGYIGNSTSIQPWSFEVRRIPNGLGLATPSVNGGNDANPMNVLHELYTDMEWGLGFPAGDIDTANWTAAANTLLSEGNGFSMLLDREISAEELIDEIQRQIDGVVFLDHRTGLWKVKLAREEAAVATITTVLDVKAYAATTWEETVNRFSAIYSDRADNYKEKPALADDSANAQLQGGGTPTTARPVSATATFPGVKDATLANTIAWRELRTLSVPLISAEIEVDRSFWDILPGDVVAWTNAERGLTARKFRVTSIDYGAPGAERITLAIVEDVFQFASGSFAAPPASGWSNPAGIPGAFVDVQVFEAPRALTYRGLGSIAAVLWASARRVLFATSFLVNARSAAGTPSGAYSNIGEGYGFMLVGSLKNALARGTAIPTTGIVIEPTPDTQATIEGAFADTTDTADVGANLLNLIKIGDEFMLVMSASTSGSDVLLGDVYRGVLDSTQAAHSAAADVFLVFVGGNLSTDAVVETHNVDVQLIGLSQYGTSVATPITTSFQMDRRNRRPTCPGRLSLGGSVFPSTTSLEAAGGGAEATGLDLDFIRRDYRTAEGGDEIQALTTDAATLFPDFPTANTTTVEVTVIDDPDGSATVLFTDTGITAASHTALRIAILKATGGALPTRMRLQLIERHLDAGDNLTSRATLEHDFDVTSALTGQFEFGALDTNVSSATYTVDAAGVHNFTLSSAYGAGNVEISENGGGFTTLIAAGLTTGASSSLSVSDTIVIRCTSTEVGPKQIDMTAPGGGTDAFGVLYS